MSFEVYFDELKIRIIYQTDKYFPVFFTFIGT